MPNQELVSRLQPLALKFARRLSVQTRSIDMERWKWFETSGHHGNFSNAGWSGSAIRFWNGPHATSDFANFRLAPGDDATCTKKPPQVIGESSASSRLTVLENRSSQVIHRERDITESESTEKTTSLSQEIAVKAALEMRTAFGYESQLTGVKAEAEITASLETAYNRAWSESETKTEAYVDRGLYSFNLQPWTRLTIGRKVARSKIKREVGFCGNIDFSVGIWSHEHYNIVIPSRAVLESVLRGQSRGQITLNGNAERGIWFEDAYRANPERSDGWLHELCRKPIVMHVDVVDVREESTLSYTFEEEKLDGGWAAESRR